MVEDEITFAEAGRSASWAASAQVALDGFVETLLLFYVFRKFEPLERRRNSFQATL